MRVYLFKLRSRALNRPASHKGGAKAETIDSRCKTSLLKKHPLGGVVSIREAQPVSAGISTFESQKQDWSASPEAVLEELFVLDRKSVV